MSNIPDSLTRYKIEQDKNAEEYNYAFGELEERTADLLAEIACIAKGYRMINIATLQQLTISGTVYSVL